MPKADHFHEPLEIAVETVRGDVRDALIGWLKAMPKSWQLMSEKEQRSYADAADHAAELLVRRACATLAAAERPCIVATLDQYVEKEGFKITCTTPGRRETAMALHDACGREVLIVTSGAEEHLGERGPADVTPDQGGLPIMDGRYGEDAW